MDVFEAAPVPGGAVRTEEWPSGARVDLGSAVHPFVLASRFFREWGAERRVDYITPEISYAHPLDDGDAAIAYRDLHRTAAGLGAAGREWRRRFQPLARHADAVADAALSPLAEVVRHAQGWAAMTPGVAASLVVEAARPLRARRAAALFSGVAAHAAAPLHSLAAASIGTTLAALAHAGGWPIPRGGARTLIDAMVSDLQAHGGHLHLNHEVRSRADMPSSRALLLATSPSDAASILGPQLSAATHRRLRSPRGGPAVFKLDIQLSEPVPWQNPEVRAAATVHVGGPAAEVHQAEADVARGRIPASPFVMLTQPTVVDNTRSPDKHIVWAYTRLPAAAPEAVITEPLLTQIDRFAPGVHDLIENIAVTSPQQFEEMNRNLIGGDILGGHTDGLGFLRRPSIGAHPWRTGIQGVYLCSSAVFPGPGVHGMTGYHAALDALRTVFHLPAPPLAP